MEHWQPLEYLGLFAIGGVVLVALAWAAVWYTLRTRELEVSGLSAEERAARLLGRALAGVWVSPAGVQAVMAAFNAVPPSERIALALAVHGMISGSDKLLERVALEKKVVALVQTFNRRTDDGSSHNVKPA